MQDFIIEVMRKTLDTCSGISTWLTQPLILGYSAMSILFGLGLGVIIGLKVYHMVNPVG